MPIKSEPRLFALLEREGRTIYFHGCVTIPEGKGRDDVARIYRDVITAKPDEWTYDDILAALAEEGFRYVASEAFWEAEA